MWNFFFHFLDTDDSKIVYTQTIYYSTDDNINLNTQFYCGIHLGLRNYDTFRINIILNKNKKVI